MTRRSTRLAYVVTHPVTADLLLRGQLAHMKRAGFEVTLIASPGPELDAVRAREDVEIIAVPMKREIDAMADAVSLRRLTGVLRRVRPDIVNASTPKAGLLGMLAARAVSAPVRIYLLRGLRLETSRGVLRTILGTTERIASACATRVVCVSESLRRVYVEGAYAAARKTCVLGDGSSNGVDAASFHRASRSSDAVRHELRIPPGVPVIGFVGRLVADKGIAALLDAHDQLRGAHPEAHLVLVGDTFAGDSVSPGLAQRIAKAKGITIVGKVSDVAPYYALMDVLAFPSLREGFPNVPLEAAAAGVPVVGFRVTGVVDAVVDGTTGLLVSSGDARALGLALARYLADPALRRAHGDAARDRAVRLFSRDVVWRAWVDEYSRLLDDVRPGAL